MKLPTPQEAQRWAKDYREDYSSFGNEPYRKYFAVIDYTEELIIGCWYDLTFQERADILELLFVHKAITLKDIK